MDLVLHYFAFVVAGFCAVNLILAKRRLDDRWARSPGGTDQRDRSESLLRVWYGSGIFYFLALGAVQWLRGYESIFFVFMPRPHDPLVVALWLATYIGWTLMLLALWRPGVAETAIAAGLVRGAISPQTLRVIGTLMLLANAVVFAMLLSGFWRFPPMRA